jgi:hypothetical protein
MDKFWGALPYAGALVLLGLVAILAFRENWGRLIDRIRKVGSIETTVPTQTPEPTPPAPPQQAHHDDSPAVTAFATIIEAELDRRGVPAAQPSARYTELLRSAAYAQMNVIFERAAWQIFASQLALLKLARSSGNAVNDERARAVFEKARTDYPEAYEHKTYDAWLNFLVSFEFIERGDTGTITLTERGVQFLLFFPATAHAEPHRL